MYVHLASQIFFVVMTTSRAFQFLFEMNAQASMPACRVAIHAMRKDDFESFGFDIL